MDEKDCLSASGFDQRNVYGNGRDQSGEFYPPWHRHTSDKTQGYEITYPGNFEEIYHIIRGAGVIQWKTDGGKIRAKKVGAGDTL